MVLTRAANMSVASFAERYLWSKVGKLYAVSYKPNLTSHKLQATVARF